MLTLKIWFSIPDYAYKEDNNTNNDKKRIGMERKPKV